MVPILKNKLEDYIVEYKNVLSNEDLKLFLQDIKQHSELFEPAYIGNKNNSGELNKDIRDTSNFNISYPHNPLYKWDGLLYNIFHLYSQYYFREVYKEYYKLFTNYSDQGYTVLKYEKNQKYTAHADWSVAGVHLTRFLSAVLYLNDDYDGGELEFSFGLKIKPKANSIILFPSNVMFTHASLPIKEGTKYAVVTWYTCNP